MTKAEALQQIEQLKKFVEELDNPPKNVVTQWPTKDDQHCEINNVEAFSIFKKEQEGHGYMGSKISGHMASIFLHGGGIGKNWYTEDGTSIGGQYLYFKPS